MFNNKKEILPSYIPDITSTQKPQKTSNSVLKIFWNKIMNSMDSGAISLILSS